MTKPTRYWQRTGLVTAAGAKARVPKSALSIFDPKTKKRPRRIGHSVTRRGSLSKP
jgi:hypothetical protein